jgi:DNA-binding MarR family transcriptional regulator
MNDLVDYILELKLRCRIEEEIAAPLGLTSRESSLIRVLRAGERVRSNELAARLGLSPSRGSRLIGSLRAKGLLAVGEEKQDRRAAPVSLSGRGATLVKKMEEAIHACEKRFCQRLSKNQLEIAREGLALLISALQ